MAHWATIGAKCVCIASEGDWERLSERAQAAPLPEKGKIYTICHIMERWGRVHIALLELVSPCLYEISAFRPAVDQSTDLAMFQRIAADAQKSIQISEDA